MKRIKIILLGLFILLSILIIVGACSSRKEVYTDVPDTAEDIKVEKSGAQLWGETCNRCHLAPSPAAYNDSDWATISLHMRIRANLSEQEISKIKEFLQSAN